MGSTEDPPHSSSANNYREEGEKLVNNWFSQHASTVAQERIAARVHIQKAAADQDRKSAGAALGTYVERLFFRIQPDLARQVRNDECYSAALIAATLVIRKEANSLYSELAGGPLTDQWMQCFDARMQDLRQKCATQTEELFHSELGLHLAADQMISITVGGEEQGIRILPKPSSSSSVGTEPEEEAPKKRGRKRNFTTSQLQQAYEMKQAGKKNHQIAKVLYGTSTPTPDQRRSVPTILKYHFGRKSPSS